MVGPAVPNGPSNRSRQRIGKLWLRRIQIGGTVYLVLWLVLHIDWAAVPGALMNQDWRFTIVGFLWLIPSHLINVVRWQCLLDVKEIPYSKLLAYYGSGLFASNFLPSSVGGDSARVLLLGRGTPWGRAMFSVALDRLMGVVALSGLAAVGLLYGLPEGLRRALWPDSDISTLTMLIAGAAVIGLGACLLRIRRKLSSIIGAQLRKWPVPHWPLAVWVRQLVLSYVLSVSSQFCLAFAVWAAIAALYPGVPIGAPIWTVICGSLASLLPIAINGLGLTESVYVVVLGYYGVPTTTALAIALLIRIFGTLLSLVGGALSLRVAD